IGTATPPTSTRTSSSGGCRRPAREGRRREAIGRDNGLPDGASRRMPTPPTEPKDEAVPASGLLPDPCGPERRGSGTGRRREASGVLSGGSTKHTAMPGDPLPVSRRLLVRTGGIRVVRGRQRDEQGDRRDGPAIRGVSPDPDVAGWHWSDWCGDRHERPEHRGRYCRTGWTRLFKTQAWTDQPLLAQGRRHRLTEP